MNLAYGTVPNGHAGDFYVAVKDLIPASVRVYVGTVPKKPDFPYVVLWGSFGDEVSESLADVPDEIRIPFRATYVGLTFAQVGWLVSQVRPALNRTKPYVSGWVSGRMRQSSLMDVQTDTDVTIPGSGAHPLFAVDEFALVAHKL